MKKLKRFLKYYKPHKLIFALDMAASLLVALIGILYPMITREMLNNLIPNKQYKDIIVYGSGLFVIYVVRMLLRYFVQYYGHVMGVRIQAQMRSDMFAQLQKLSYKFYDEQETGKIMSRMTSDLFDITELAHHGPENLLISSVSVIVSFVYLATINIWLTLIIFGCVPFLLLIAGILRKKMRNAFTESRKSIAVINASLESSISGIRVTKAFTNSKKEKDKFEDGNSQFVTARKKAYKAMGQFGSSTGFITDVFNVVVLIAGGLFLYADSINLGDYTAFITSVGMFISPVMTLINFMEQFQDGATGFERFLEIMDVEPEKDAPEARDAGRLEGDIEFCDVSHSYEGKERDALDHVNLKIDKGSKFALVGPSGGGKTTICHLIPHFYNIKNGVIKIDGSPICEYTLESLRKNIGIVQQDVFLFNTTIKDNILYGRLDATDEEVIEAAKRANIHEFIMTLADGYDTIVGERGVRLSGGQKQRLAIARVFLKNPSILILDEATSALDNATEIQIQQALDELCHGRTTIVVAHRLSTIRNADKIAVITEGKVVEVGGHEELLAKNGAYKELYDLQFKVQEMC